ncbi:hypothetical protein NIES2100_35240 [Calothrix sp. NIES-2100]|uniref:hypothetical protein n=1 Tax=Calothrix sp. NIES-2100 TaxID=1954172 RepID=UPI000B5E0F55|nr:hypothetical protein NIES2100_35240 [Calothrix sp. NIES-2100]
MGQNNAARRLYDAFQYAFVNGNSAELAYKVLANAFKVENPELNPHFLIEIYVLLSEVEKKLKLLKKVDNVELYVKAIREIQFYIQTSNPLLSQWDGIKNQIQNRNFIFILDACANFIAQEQPEPELTEEQLQEYLEQCESLLQEVVSSDLAEDIKTFLVVRLEEICSAIRHYKIGGPERLRTVVEANIGAIILRSDAYTPEQKKGIISKIFGLLMTFGGVLDLAANTQGYLLPKAAELLKYLLPPG